MNLAGAGRSEADAATVPIDLSRLLYLALNALALVSSALQLVIGPSFDNIVAVGAVLAAALLTLQYLERTRGFDDAPVSSLALLGLCVTTQWTSLVAQTFSWHALVDDLQVPKQTFALLSSIQLLAIGVHWVYRRFEPLQALRGALTRGVLVPLGAFTPLSPPAIWCLSMVGATALALGGSAEPGDSGLKFLQAFTFFAWMPAMIPIQHALHGRTYCSMAPQWPLLIGYMVLLMGIGMAMNARQMMLIGPIQLLLVMLMYGLRIHRPARRRMLLLLVGGAIAAGLFTFVARDVATAMVVVRDQRATTPPLQQIKDTFDALNDRAKLEVYRDQELASKLVEVYDEVYLDNPLLARFSETKFHDNMLALLMKFNQEERDSIGEVTWIKILVMLPQPVIDKLGLDIDKERYEWSMGDYYRSLNESPDFLGGYATGSIWVDLLAIFGWWTPFVTALMLVFLFVLLDMQSLTDSEGRLVLSALAVCTAWATFLYGLGAESLAAKTVNTLRGVPEKVLLYCVAAAVMRLVFPWRPQPGSPMPERERAGAGAASST